MTVTMYNIQGVSEQLQEDIQTAQIHALRHSFRQDVKQMFIRHGMDKFAQFQLEPNNRTAEPVYIVTGVSFIPTDHDNGHCISEQHNIFGHNDDGRTYVMNNSAMIAQSLLDHGHRVILHSGNEKLARQLIANHPQGHQARFVSGNVSDPALVGKIYDHLAEESKVQPISDVRLMAYQSFAQGCEEPFKPMHQEDHSFVEQACSNRIRFVFNMAAMAYDLLENKNAAGMRIVSLSALAGNRASYGLVADAADKFMNELMWRTFHLEANISTGKPVTIVKVNPGITAACNVYNRDSVINLVSNESIADGFPFENDVLSGRKALPIMSSGDVGWVAERILTANDNQNLNEDMPQSVKELLYAGYKPEELKQRFADAVKIDGDTISVGNGRLPEHCYASNTIYGALPDHIKPGEYRRISLTPPGQYF